MTLIFYILTIAFLTVVMVLSYFYNWRRRNPLLLCAFTGLGISLLVTMYCILGKPLPLNHITTRVYSSVDIASLLFYKFDEGKAIYLLLQVPNSDAPTFVVLPWGDGKLAEKLGQLQGAVDRDQAETGGRALGILVEHPFDSSLELRPSDFKHPTPPEGSRIQKVRPQQLPF
jgi:hypothetical protein